MVSEECAWHRSSDCMQKKGWLMLQQHTDQPQQDLVKAQEILKTHGWVEFYLELGAFCTTSALLSWLEATTGAMRQHTRELHGRGPGSRRHPGRGEAPRVRREGRRRQR